MNKKIILNRERDYPLLVYIWKWKVVTTASIHNKFFPKKNPVSVYNRLLKLSKFNIIAKRVVNDGSMSVWALDKMGYKIIRDQLPALKEEGFKSENIEHDLYCSAAHQGDFFLNKPECVEMFTEQQLRRYDLDYIPSWVPLVELHRPDGYWFIRNNHENIVVSLELEKSRKNSANYNKLANYYIDFPSHYRVLWIVEGQTLIRFIKSIMERAKCGPNIHNFILLKDFLKNGWSSIILNGPEKGSTISKFFYGKGCAFTVPSQCHGTFNSLLNTKLKHCNN